MSYYAQRYLLLAVGCVHADLIVITIVAADLMLAATGPHQITVCFITQPYHHTCLLGYLAHSTPYNYALSDIICMLSSKRFNSPYLFIHD